MRRRAFVLFLLVVMAGGARAADSDALYQRLAARAESIATVKFVLGVKTPGAEEEREIEGEADCLAIDERGMVLCSNTELGGYAALWGRMMGNSFNVTATPKNLKVSFGASTESFDGQVLARDSDRDLVWIEVALPAETKVAFVDLERSAELAVGEQFFVVRPLDKFFGRAPLISTGTIGAVVTKPRKLFVPQVASSGGFGRPVFDARGELVGVTVLQMPGSEDQTAGLMGSPMSFLGQTTRLEDMVGGLILPAAEVAKATRLARESFGESRGEKGD